MVKKERLSYIVSTQEDSEFLFQSYNIPYQNGVIVARVSNYANHLQQLF